MKILAIGAHPDDIEIAMFGTLLKYKLQGHTINIVVATDGRRGGKADAIELIELRKCEANASAELLEITPIYLGIEDGRCAYDQITYRKIVDIIEQLSPDIIFTHNQEDYHPDHMCISKMVTDAAWVPVFYMETLKGLNFDPEFYIDITKEFDRKREAILKHQSQPCTIFAKETEVINRFRAVQYFWDEDVKYAEGFKVHLKFPNMKILDYLPIA